MLENEISGQVVDAAFKIHYKYGPGLLELPYEKMLARELTKRGFKVQRQVPIPLEYDGEMIDESFRADMIVNEKVLLEIKATENMHSVYQRQLNTYLKVTGLKLGLVINFGMGKVKDGIIRMVNGKLENGPDILNEIFHPVEDQESRFDPAAVEERKI